MASVGAETPSTPEQIYMARGSDVELSRPIFTGDVLREPTGRMLLIVQHPCALRTHGSHLVPRLLCAVVDVRSGMRTDWSKESIRIMPLPRLLEDDVDYAANFVDLELVDATLVSAFDRVATMSELGVNLLMQRWVVHNSRVVIPTITFQEQTAGPFAEAELLTEWVDALQDIPGGDADAFNTWIRQQSDTASDMTRQEMLESAQLRSSVRRELRQELKARALIA